MDQEANLPKSNDINLPYIDSHILRNWHFTLKSKSKSDFNHADVKSVHINWTSKIINMKCYEINREEGISIWNWCDKLEEEIIPNETLIFTTYTGCGEIIYEKEFHGIKILKRENKFDYSSSEIVLHEVSLSFTECTNEK